MIGYSPGTQVIITFADPSQDVKIGQIYTVGNEVLGPGKILFTDDLSDYIETKTYYQSLIGVFGDGDYFHPIDWMRPLKDPDSEEQASKILEQVK